MPQSIPISDLVSVTPAVISAGGLVSSLNGLIVTDNTRVPIGSVSSFADAASVAAYFGNGTTEASLASVYFGGFTGALDTPALLSFAQYATAAVAGYVRGGSMAAVPLATLQGYTGTMTVTVDGTPKTSSAISLSGATSYSNAATIIQAAFTTPNFTVSYDTQAAAFKITSNSTGATSLATVTTGALATNLKLTAAAGAVTSNGSAIMTPVAGMTGIAAIYQNFASFMTTFEPIVTDKVMFANWANSQANRIAYAMWDTSATPATSGDTSSAGYLITQAGYSGTIAIWGAASLNKAAFVMGWAASLNFTRQEGRWTLAWRTQSGLAPDVADLTTATNLKTNGYNFYGVYANSGAQWNLFQDGHISGPFLWADSFMNQIWFNAALQNAQVALLQNTGNIPYNTDGYTMIEQALLDPITQAINFGAIRAGVSLTQAQIAAVNARAGRDISATLFQRGWYILVSPAPPSVRVARGSPAITVFYTDGQSVQKIALASIQVQ